MADSSVTLTQALGRNAKPRNFISLGNGAYIAKSINYHSYTKQSSSNESLKSCSASGAQGGG